MADVARFPQDLKEALDNVLTDKEVDELLAQPGTAPRFLVGVLMLPTVLKYYLEVDQGENISKYMTQAVLYGHRMYKDAKGSPPVLYESAPDHKVLGILVFGLTQEYRNAIHKFEMNMQQHLASVQVEVYTLEYTRRMIEVGIFRSDPAKSKSGLVAIETCMWDPMPFVESWSYQDILEAQETVAIRTEYFPVQPATRGNSSKESGNTIKDDEQDECVHVSEEDVREADPGTFKSEITRPMCLLKASGTAIWDPIPFVGEHFLENRLRLPETYGSPVIERDVSRASSPNSSSKSAIDDKNDDENYVKVPDDGKNEIGMDWLI